MDNFLKTVQENGPYIMNATIMFIGIFASFLSAFVKKRTQIGGIVFLAVAFNVITWLVYGNKEILYWTIALTLIWVVLCVPLIWTREIVSRKRIGRMIRGFTDNADQFKPICIFGGDLNFFGDVVVNIKRLDRILKNNNIIEYNKQYNQIKNKGFRKIQILCMKPEGESEEDKKTRIRIGYLKEKLKGNLEIKFFEEKACDDCPDRKNCLACEVCKKCPEGKACKRTETQICDKLRESFQSRCYNPDTQLRGRIVKRKSDGSTSAAIVTTHKSGKSYILKEYSSNTKECTIYLNIWDVWWKKCKVDEDFINQCITDYKNFISAEGE